MHFILAQFLIADHRPDIFGDGLKLLRGLGFGPP
jgi:hypothetical protein